MRKATILAVVATAFGLLAFAGCAGAGHGHQHSNSMRDLPRDGNPVVFVSGLMPEWDLTDMAERSDAVAVGTLSEQLRTSQERGGTVNNPAKFDDKYTSYEMTVEKTFHPASLPEHIAVMVGPHPVPRAGRRARFMW